MRLIRQMLTESLMLSFCGAIVGLILAFVGTRVLARLTSISIPLLGEVHIDGTVLLFTLLVAVATGSFLDCCRRCKCAVCVCTTR